MPLDKKAMDTKRKKTFKGGSLKKSAKRMLGVDKDTSSKPKLKKKSLTTKPTYKNTF